MKNCLGIINLDEDQSRMGELTRYRTLAAVPISARYRLVDFVLSNMTNSGIESIGIFTENKSKSLLNHLSNGRPWDLHRKKEGLRVFNFGDYKPNYDDVHNFLDNMEFIENSRKDYVLISPSYMICNIDYNEALAYHKKSKNDITIIYKEVDNANKKFLDCSIVNKENDRVVSIGENIGRECNAKINMEMYIMDRELFIDMVHECIKTGIHRKIKQYIHANLNKFRVGAFEFNGYLSCVNDIKSYFDTNLDILNEDINKELFYSNKPIYTRSQDEAPTQYTDNNLVSNSIIANGSYIEGEVTNCIIGRRVVVEKGAKLKNCVIMHNTIIGYNASLDRVIIDEGTLVNRSQEIKGTSSSPVTILKENVV